jgi:hypothetical protein
MVGKKNYVYLRKVLASQAIDRSTSRTLSRLTLLRSNKNPKTNWEIRMSTCILCHGAWHTGNELNAVAEPIRAAGHTVHTPTLKGNRPGDSKKTTLDEAIGSLVEYFTENTLKDKIKLSTSPAAMQIPKSYINCTEDTALSHSLGWHPRLSDKMGLFRFVECPGSHEVCFTNPAVLAEKIVQAGRD